jgi:serine O-acetyltransferase
MSRLPYYFYTVYNFLYKLKIPFLPKVLMYINRILFGAYIPPSAIIGAGTRFSYGGSGVVVHARAKVGQNCTIGPCSTIGGRSKIYGVPRIGNNVYIGGGSKILGDIEIGDNVVIGANAVVINSIKSYCVAAGIPAEIIKEDINIEDYI